MSENAVLSQNVTHYRKGEQKSETGTMSQIVEYKSPEGTGGSLGMVGIWFNTNRESPEIAKVVLARQNQRLMLRAYGVKDGTVTDWGETDAIPHASPDKPGEVTGFEATFETGGIKRHLAANLKLGVLVIQCYNHTGSGGQGSYFTREFFHQQIQNAAEGASAHAGDIAVGTGPRCSKAGDWLMTGTQPPTTTIDLNCYLGIWRNTCRHTQFASHIELLRDIDGYLVRGYGIDAPADWGAVPAIAYADEVGSQQAAGFFADYDFGFMDMRLAANFNKGLLIIAAYNRFKDGSGRANYFTREFFYDDRQPV